MTTTTEPESPIPGAKRENKSDEIEEEPPTKKVRLEFDFKKFKKLIQTELCSLAIQQFEQIFKQNQSECILNFFNEEGSLVDIVRAIDGKPGIVQVSILEIVNDILLQVGTNLPQFEKKAVEGCEYLLKHFLPIINKMLGLSSSGDERYAMLKLLTTIVTFSSSLAKDILVNVRFNNANIKLMTKASDGKREVRDVFIRFIVAFIVDGQLQAITSLIENTKLMGGVFFGLKYDKCENVCLLLSAMKTNILENSDISKTMKMRMFNTVVLKHLVDLYNWTGPGSVQQRGKSINKVQKAEVSESVHDFLLILCTTRHGIIFHDPLFGLDNKQNQLLGSVLQMLEKPWNHSYATELVKKICYTCPDLIGTVWKLLQPYLEPRATAQWFKAINFATELLQLMDPSCLGTNLQTLTDDLVPQLIPLLVAPYSIISALTPKDHIYENYSVRYHVFHVIQLMTERIANYVDFFSNYFDKDKLVLQMSRYVSRYFPKIDQVLRNWNKGDDSDRNITPQLYLDNALTLLKNYKIYACELIDSADAELDLESFLSSVDSNLLKLRIADFFTDIEPIFLNSNSDTFKDLIVTGFRVYHENKDELAYRVLKSLLEKSAIFYGCEFEIDIWIKGILNVKKYTDEIAQYFLGLIEKYQMNVSKYDGMLNSNSRFSPLFLVLNKHGNSSNKILKQYNSFVIFSLCHLQFDLNVFQKRIKLPNDLANYINSWCQGEICVEIPGKLGRVIDKVKSFPNDFINGVIKPDNYSDWEMLVFRMAVFYLSNLIEIEKIDEKHFENFELLVDYLVDKNVISQGGYYETIFENPNLLAKLNLFDKNEVCTQFLVKIIKKLNVPDDFLAKSREQIVTDLIEIFQENKRVQSDICVDLLKIFNIECDDCIKLLETFSNSLKNRPLWKVAAFCLDQIATQKEMKPVDNSIIKNLCECFILLIDEKVAHLHQLFGPLLNYLRVFPHNLEAVPESFFEKLCQMSEYNKTNLDLCVYLLQRKPEFLDVISRNIENICSKKSFVIHLLKTIITYNNSDLEKQIFEKIHSHIVKILEKPEKAHVIFQTEYESIGYLIETYMEPDQKFEKRLKFEVSELFHFYLLHKVFRKIKELSAKMILTSIHLLNSAFKSDKSVDKLAQVFLDFLNDSKLSDLNSIQSNESFKVFSKFCLKYGITEIPSLMKILSKLVQSGLDEENCSLLLEMMLSHSRFLDVILSNGDKSALVEFWWVLYEKFPNILKKEHVPLVLSAYGATRSVADQTILKILKICESHLTSAFIEYKPFLWGSAAAFFYSIRSGVRPTLDRQPKISKVLYNLDFEKVKKTIRDPDSEEAYDAEFLLPLFSLILSHENLVPMHIFCRSGALALTVTGLRSDCQATRYAACHVLSRFHFHLEAKQSGKDDLLWIRYITAICKGIAVLPDLQLNNFACVFLARTAVILTNPHDVMYEPLAQYLSAKEKLTFDTVPELYTLLHSPDVDTKIHKHFVLSVLRDGMKSNKDFKIFLKSMAFKLISQLSTCESLDTETKLLTLNVLKACLRIPFGLRVLCGNMSFITHLNSLLVHSLEKNNRILIGKILEIILEIVELDNNPHRNFQIALNMSAISENDCLMSDGSLETYYYKILATIVCRFPHYLGEAILDKFLDRNKDKVCLYFLAHGCHFVRESDLKSDLQLIFYNKLK